MVIEFPDVFTSDGRIDMDADAEVYKELHIESRKSQIKEEMLDYVITLVNKEYDGRTDNDAFGRWEDYKRKMGIKT